MQRRPASVFSEPEEQTRRPRVFSPCASYIFQQTPRSCLCNSCVQNETSSAYCCMCQTGSTSVTSFSNCSESGVITNYPRASKCLTGSEFRNRVFFLSAANQGCHKRQQLSVSACLPAVRGVSGSTGVITSFLALSAA